MPVATPRFLLISDTDRSSTLARWRFVLQPLEADNAPPVEAADIEPAVHGERLELLAVVRGLEALGQPSRVTLLTTSRYVSGGLHYGLAEWRANGWQWEHFGTMTPVKNRDLWQRLDRTLEFHEVDCRLLRFDLAQVLGLDGVRFAPAACISASQSAAFQGPHYLRKRAKAAISADDTRGSSSSVSDWRPQVSDCRKTNGLPAVKGQKNLVASGRIRQQKTFVTKRLTFFRTWRWFVSTFCRRWVKLHNQLTHRVEAFWLRLRQLGTGLTPPPWLDG